MNVIVGTALDAAECGALGNFAGVGVRILVNGEEAAAGSGANVLESPLQSLTWLANHLAAEGVSREGVGTGLAAGDFVMSGAASLLPAAEWPLGAGDRVRAEFDGMGSAEVRLD